MFFIYIFDYNIYLFIFSFLDICALFILIYIWCINKNLYVKHPYIFFIFSILLIVAIAFFSYKVYSIVYIKGNLDNTSNNMNNSGSNNNNPKFNGKPNFTSGVFKENSKKKEMLMML